MKRWLGTLVGRVFARLFAERLRRYRAWEQYEIGLTGVGPTALDDKPTFARPWLPRRLRQGFEAVSKEEATFRRDAFRQSCLEVLGEDPDEWM